MKGLSPELKRLLNKEKKNKYGNHKVQCLSKHNHDSKLEANWCNRLLAQKQNGEIQTYEIQRSFDLIVNDKLVCKHIVDFLVVKFSIPPYEMEVHDTKGFQTPDWKIKKKLFEALYPSIKYEVITQH